MKDRAYVVLSIGELRKIVRLATKKATHTGDVPDDRCVVLESEVTRMPSSEAFHLHSSRLTARMAGDAFAFYYHP